MHGAWPQLLDRHFNVVVRAHPIGPIFKGSTKGISHSPLLRSWISHDESNLRLAFTRIFPPTDRLFIHRRQGILPVSWGVVGLHYQGLWEGFSVYRSRLADAPGC